jgi:hypothetical protein
LKIADSLLREWAWEKIKRKRVRYTFDSNLTEVGLGVRVEPLPIIQNHLAWWQ